MRDQRRRRTCKWCERPVEECGSLSTRGSCRDCSLERMSHAFEQAPQQMRSATYLARWRLGMANAAGAKLPEGWDDD